ncbi:hypothetical protein [Aquimarina latercula]|uniref:hypothetical protein n=1 Tax=Aquimarina latercula TaxID=987 RepID=UPI000482E3B7|nr:hypothetical protein [Aquimarina latercula]
MVHYSIDIEKNNTKWVGMLNKVEHYNIPPKGKIIPVKEVEADSYMDLYHKMFEAGFFAKMEHNQF